ncbi:uncharacterized protein HD556DRAFT_1474817 [Suillus plorans]|uniref:Uncharacterized protein n=1 Tax=Suillus plorans TaxID=116603 RepID=A0A9P7AQW0_9AGAM|nr:uncharacterized protein HD556DRAFT_1474817 [Suillus plorans]KAG1794604.1 hypothetical protein HD556DRAFT_1474817 [Suillus plorans]
MPDRFGMPFRTEQSAPRFTGDVYGVFAFLQSVDQLGQKCNLSDTELIKYTLRYIQCDHKELWAGCPEARGTSWLEFTNEILSSYPEGGIHEYTRPDPKPEIPEPEESDDYEWWTLPLSDEYTPAQEPLTSEIEISAPKDPIATSDAPEGVRSPEISDLTLGQVQLPSEQLDVFVEVIDADVLTSEVLDSELTSLEDNVPEIPETSADEFPEIWDICTRSLDHELVLPSPDRTDHFVHAVAVALFLTGYVTWSRYHFELSRPKIRTSKPETPETHFPVIPKICPMYPQFPCIVSPYRHPSHRIRNIRLHHPVYQRFQYPRPSHSQITFYQYESQRRLYLRKKL